MRPTFSGGPNIALKVPPPLWDATVAFYRDTLGLAAAKHPSDVADSEGFAFGPVTLWVEAAPQLGAPEVWLELHASDVDAAAEHLEAAQVPRRDEVEPLPPGLAGFWVASPASVIHFVGEAPAVTSSPSVSS